MVAVEMRLALECSDTLVDAQQRVPTKGKAYENGRAELLLGHLADGMLWASE
jgi:hypothetical protein